MFICVIHLCCLYSIVTFSCIYKIRKVVIYSLQNKRRSMNIRGGPPIFFYHLDNRTHNSYILLIIPPPRQDSEWYLSLNITSPNVTYVCEIYWVNMHQICMGWSQSKMILRLLGRGITVLQCRFDTGAEFGFNDWTTYMLMLNWGAKISLSNTALKTNH